MQPRQVAYMASDTSLSYTYSHTKLQPEAWHPQVAQGVPFPKLSLQMCFDWPHPPSDMQFYVASQSWRPLLALSSTHAC